MDTILEEIKKAIAVAAWTTEEPPKADWPGKIRCWSGTDGTWRLLVVVGESARGGFMDGTATTAGTIVHLTPELAKLAAEKARAA